MKTAISRGRGRPANGRADGVVRLDKNLIAQAKMVALARGKPVGLLLSELLADPLSRAYETSIRQGPRIEFKR